MSRKKKKESKKTEKLVYIFWKKNASKLTVKNIKKQKMLVGYVSRMITINFLKGSSTIKEQAGQKN